MLEIFKLTDDFKSGSFIPQPRSTVWTERYRDMGEFKITIPIFTDFISKLPLGSYISHTDTKEVMIVEDLILQNGYLTYTGRSAESWLEHRAITPGGRRNHLGDQNPSYTTYPEATTWDAALYLVNVFLGGSLTIGGDPYARIEGFTSRSEVSGLVEKPAVPQFRAGYIGDQVRSLLGNKDCGIRTERPSAAVPYMSVVIHNGTDRSNTVRFSEVNGDLENPTYLWSNRTYKTAVFVGSDFATHRTIYLKPGHEGYEVTDYAPIGKDLRVHVIDLPNSEPKVIGNWDSYIQHTLDIQNFAQQELPKHKMKVAITADISPKASFVYNRDYFMGDIVAIEGDYGASAKQRVTTYTITSDESGTVGVPGLSAYEPEVVGP